MSTPPRAIPAPWLLSLALLLSACGGPVETVRGCSTSSECGAGALCVQGACVTNRPPVVSFPPPQALTTNRLVSIDASATDPDSGDSATRFTWTVAPVGAGCEAEPEPSAGPRLELVFWCAGTYEVVVVAEDGRGGVSQPVRQLVDVALATGAPVVLAGPDQQVDHLCGGTPFACRPALLGSPVALALAASATDPAGGALMSRWRMIPPPGVDPRVTVTYGAGEGSLTTDAWVESPGGQVAGTWRFQLRVTSATGLLGKADQLVRIGNRPPVLTARAVSLEHRYEGGAWVARGTLPLPATDPDGDPVALKVTLEETATDGCVSHLGSAAAGSVSFDTRCTVAERLIGLASRSLRVVASDGNGAATEAVISLEIANRPPEVRLASNPAGNQVAVDHGVAPCPGGAGSCFVAAGKATFEVFDPDGDPVSSPAVTAAWAAALASSAGEATTSAGTATFRFTTPVERPAEFRQLDGRTGFTLVAGAADSFGAAGRLEVAVVALNRPPVLKQVFTRVVVPHRYDSRLHRYTATATLAVFEDPDGDPLGSWGPSGDPDCGVTFAGGAASLTCQHFYAPGFGLPPLSGFVGNHRVTLTASDGWEQASAAASLDVQDGAPAVSSSTGTVEACRCYCPKMNPDGTACIGGYRWAPDPDLVPLPVTADDADGDPLQVTTSVPNASGETVRTIMAYAASTTLARPTLPLDVLVTVDDGVSRTQATIRLTGVTCQDSGVTCVP
jgi:hypothetical protein